MKLNQRDKLQPWNFSIQDSHSDLICLWLGTISPRENRRLHHESEEKAGWKAGRKAGVLKIVQITGSVRKTGSIHLFIFVTVNFNMSVEFSSSYNCLITSTGWLVFPTGSVASSFTFFRFWRTFHRVFPDIKFYLTLLVLSWLYTRSSTSYIFELFQGC